MDSIEVIKLYAKAEELENQANRLLERARLIRARANSILYNGTDIKCTLDMKVEVNDD